MYASYTPEQMGLRQTRVWKRDGDNFYTFAKVANARRFTGETARTRDHRAVKAVIATAKVAAKRTQKVTKVDTKLILDKVARVWYDCTCGRMTRRPDGKCTHSQYVSSVEHATKEHL